MPEEHSMRFSYCMLPDYSFDEMIDMIKTADELGFYACYSVDETWHKDLWVLFTRRRARDQGHPLRPERHPRLPARADADLPADGVARRAHRRPHRDRRLDRQLRAARRSTRSTGRAASRSSRLKEAIHVMRTFLDEGAIDVRGRLLQVQRPVHVRPPVQEADPDQDGRDEGPALVPHRGRDRRRHAPGARLLARGLRLLHRAPRGSAPRRPAATRSARQRRLGRDRGERGLRRGQAGGRILVAFYISSMPPEQLARHGIDASELGPVVDALGGGDVAKAHQPVRAPLRREALASRARPRRSSSRSRPTSSRPA